MTEPHCTFVDMQRDTLVLIHVALTNLLAELFHEYTNTQATFTPARI